MLRYHFENHDSFGRYSIDVVDNSLSSAIDKAREAILSSFYPNLNYYEAHEYLKTHDSKTDGTHNVQMMCNLLLPQFTDRSDQKHKSVTINYLDLAKSATCT